MFNCIFFYCTFIHLHSTSRWLIGSCNNSNNGKPCFYQCIQARHREVGGAHKYDTSCPGGTWIYTFFIILCVTHCGNSSENKICKYREQFINSPLGVGGFEIRVKKIFFPEV